MAEGAPRTPPVPPDEEQRLASLHDLALLDTGAEERFDRITRLVQRVLGVEIATLTLVDSDRQWFKSRQGLDGPDDDVPREDSFCAHTIVGDDTLHVPDATADPRFAENPFVTGSPGVRLYAGAPIRAPDGATIGSLCAIDSRPRALDPDDLETLSDLAQMAEKEIAALTLAITDEMTGLTNRRGLTVLGAHVLTMARRMEFAAECVYIDVDGLKRLNDSLGHEMGDALLTDVARLLESTFRGSDVIARLGGDEYCVILTGTASQGAARAIERLRAAAARLNAGADRPYEVSMSIGHVGFPADTLPDLEEMLGKADAAMYVEKRARAAAR